MSLRAFKILLALTLVALCAAAAAIWLQPPALQVARAGDPLFASLADGSAVVGEIAIEDAAGRYSLKAGSDGLWVLSEKGNYPIDSAKVRALLLALGELRPVEAKTQDPARFHRLQVEDIGPDAKSRRITVTGADGQVIADVILGTSRGQLVLADGAGDGGGTYYRLPGQAQAWLGSGRITLPATAADFLDKRLLQSQAEQVRRVVITHPGGTVVLAERADEASPLELKNGLATGEVADDAAVQKLAAPLDPLTFEDVAADGTVALPAEATVRTTISTFDGLELTFELAKVGEQGWARIAVSKASDWTLDAEAAAALETKIAEIQTATKGWVFQLPAGTFAYLTFGPDQLKKPAQ